MPKGRKKRDPKAYHEKVSRGSRKKDWRLVLAGRKSSIITISWDRHSCLRRDHPPSPRVFRAGDQAFSGLGGGFILPAALLLQQQQQQAEDLVVTPLMAYMRKKAEGRGREEAKEGPGQGQEGQEQQ